MNRIKDIALFFDGLSEEELKAIKHWIKNTTEERLAKTATEMLEHKNKEVLSMVANNAFMLKELKEEGKEEGIKLTKKIFKLLNSGKSIDEIAKECEISVEEVEEIVAD
ncbi:hypothetical protein [Clostridium sp.]|uniref:hypothetical protein n=1 Tax=Clostridium sp. TaxID=1506 RepID=UPI003F67E392